MTDELIFSGNELLLMYYLVHDHICENNEIIDACDFSEFSKNDLIDNNKLANSALRKLRHALLNSGINPDTPIHEMRS